MSDVTFFRGENPLRAEKLNQAFSERVYRGGDTMLGMLTLAMDPLQAFDAATKQYVDSRVSTAGNGKFLLLTGGTLTGLLTLSGPPTAPLHATTKAYVDTLVSGSVAGVTSFNTRTGAVTLALADITGAGGAPLASPVFTGDARAVTPTTADNDTSIATTAYVKAQGYQTAAQVATAVVPAQNNVGRNLLHNSMFNVVQRGVGPWTAGYTADRWRINSSLDAVTCSVVAQNDSGRAQVGDDSCRYVVSLGVTGNAGASAYSSFSQPIESIARLAGKTVVVSFYAAASAALKIGANILLDYGTGGSPSSQVWAIPTGMSVTASTTWTRYSVTITVPSTTGKTLGTNGNDSSALWLWLSSGATNNANAGNIGVQSGTFYLWGVQLEVGSTATPLEKPDPELQLRQCQRFYQTGTAGIAGYSGAGAIMQVVSQLPVMPRAAPTYVNSAISQTNCSGSAAAQFGAVGSYSITTTVTTTGQASCFLTYTASADL